MRQMLEYFSVLFQEFPSYCINIYYKFPGL